MNVPPVSPERQRPYSRRQTTARATAFAVITTAAITVISDIVRTNASSQRQVGDLASGVPTPTSRQTLGALLLCMETGIVLFKRLIE